MFADSEPPSPEGDAACWMGELDAPFEPTPAVLGTLVADLADAVLIADAEGTIVFWNAAATRVFGFDQHEALGQSLDLIIPERLRGRHWDGYHQTVATGITHHRDELLEVPAIHRDGRTLSIAFTVTVITRPGTRLPWAIAAVVRDDTERWQERRRLRAELAARPTTDPA